MKIDTKKDLIDEELLNNLFSEDLYKEIIESRTFCRLKKIHFLGAIDYLYKQNNRKTYTRYTHTLSVATLALKYAQLGKLTVSAERYLVCAALLHDIGHAPLSHSMEPSFKKLFNISHHIASNKIIRGTSPLGDEIAVILRKYKINFDKLINLLDNKSQKKYTSALNGPINIDTIDGIFRAHSYLSEAEQYKHAPKPMDVVEALFDTKKDYILDNFWGLKNRVYEDIINKKINVYADKVTQQYILDSRHVIADEFYWSEAEFKEKHSLLFTQLNGIKEKNIPEEELKYNKRLYTIDRNNSEIEKKYIHKKTPNYFPLNRQFQNLLF
ncbi:hypothetical protein [uncultured Gammaproteobacteria bacterium]|jgi:hypothetical protein|nr:hypothetical protein BROOK1789B_329 [Bathymodiolus brooksi thiotrophic gill symbiont]CAC9624476.1 hypothetical protein [uncultured Gammaproteobacteria bacterium]CAC9959584.1 hypothetical protein [uncultured Gammaproteobacteria bacterium]CAC9977876.1 hypothetical protein [uncultured Gammaproteobacteria bacterium]SHE20531.1 Putative dNTP triphosphohydrolase, Archaeal subgroup [Bathymodiolus brooksi thiotrophic gill symbiont]